MPYLTVGRENSADVELHYNDHGAGGPHNICWTHPDEVNAALLAFLAR